VTRVALSADGSRLASAGLDKTVKVWDAIALVAAAEGNPPRERTEKEKTEVAQAPAQAPAAAGEEKPLRAGMIGLDTSHVEQFGRRLNDSNPKPEFAGCRIVAAYPKGSPDIQSSTSRVPGYTKFLQDRGVEIVDSIEALVQKVDVVFLETNDGRPHLEQVLPVLKAGKPVFIDKPIAGSLADAIAIVELSRKYNCPMFSSSGLRFDPETLAIRNGKLGEVRGCDAYSRCVLEPTHPDFFWYGIHGVETLFTIMGPGIESVTRVHTPGIDIAVGVWKGGRVGTYRGIRAPEGGREDYGATVFGRRATVQAGKNPGYDVLVAEIVKFFRTKQPPVAAEETLEIYAFMEAADESKRLGGVPVKIETVMVKAREAAKARMGQ
jgi:predicted dehydrogenase